MRGLAEEMSQSGGQTQMGNPMPPQGGRPQQAQQPTVEEVIEALLKGMDPEKMIQMGVAPELIMQAIEILEKELAMQESAGQAPQGLAAQSAMDM